MHVFVVVRTGIYNHEIVGVFSDIRAAIRRGEKMVCREKDHYHEARIYQIVVNGDIALKYEGGPDDNTENEDQLVAVVSWDLKGNAAKTKEI